MLLKSLRWRLQLWHGLLLVIVLAGFGLTAYQLQRATRLRRIDDELQERLTVAGSLVRRSVEGPGRPPFERFPPPNRREEFPRPSIPDMEPPRKERGEQDGGINKLPGPDSGGERRSRLANPEVNPGSEPADLPPLERRRIPRGQPSFSEELHPLRKEIHLSPQAVKLFEGSGSNSYYYVVWARDGTILSKSDSAPDHVPRPGTGEMRERNTPRGPAPNLIRARGNQREIFHYSPPGECILAGRNIGQEVREMRRFAGLLLGAGGAVLVFGLAGGWWLSTRAIRPIKMIGETAARIASGDLSQRIPVENSENELDQLAGVLNSTFARLEAAFAQQAQFTSDAAHELRTPVSVLLTQTQSVLTRDRSSAEYRETLQACQRAAQRMRRLIESLLELARLDAGQECLKREEVDLAQMSGECIELLRPLANERKISVRSAISPAHCMGDADRLKQVFTNLINNAIHYNNEGGEIQVSVEQVNGTAIVSVADTGVGISPENIPHIFERFWRADPARSYSDGRSGLGLAIAKSIVDAHGGAIEIMSAPGKGSTFLVRLPV